MHQILETDRLSLREFTLEDTDFIIALLNSPGWLEFIGDRQVTTTETAITYLQNGPIKSYAENGFGLSLVERKEDRKAIGMCGIIKREGMEHPDIGFAFLPAYTGTGYAFEIANATLNFAKDQLQLPVILGITVPTNHHSVRLLEKIGLHYVGPFHYPDDDEELSLYST
jgi:RimJ/RimL family protein N-acetyltransferase